MLFKYKALTKSGEERIGTIEANSEDIAISSIQRRGLVIVSIKNTADVSLFEMDIAFFSSIKNKDIVVLSRQIATLFSAQVPVLRAFRLIADESSHPVLRQKLNRVANDIQGGLPISEALNKHPSVFSDFYVNMVKSGEETGKMSDAFSYLADYLDRSYELTSKIKTALTYPVFVISVFALVMIGMFTFIIPRITEILVSGGQEIPGYTKVVIGISNLFVNYGILMLIIAIFVGAGLWKYRDEKKLSYAYMILAIPAVGELFRKLYLARFSDNMGTMLSSGIPMVRALETTANVVGNEAFRNVLLQAAGKVKSGDTLSKALSEHREMPGMLLQMLRVGEETGQLGVILKKIAVFYKREVDASVDTIVSLIEPAMIVALGLGVGTILTAVMIPIYNIAGGI